TSRDIPVLNPQTQSWRFFSNHTTSSADVEANPPSSTRRYFTRPSNSNMCRPRHRSHHAVRPSAVSPNWIHGTPNPRLATSSAESVSPTLSVFGEAEELASFTTVTYGQLVIPSAMLSSSAWFVPER